MIAERVSVRGRATAKSEVSGARVRGKARAGFTIEPLSACLVVAWLSLRNQMVVEGRSLHGVKVVSTMRNADCLTIEDLPDHTGASP